MMALAAPVLNDEAAAPVPVAVLDPVAEAWVAVEDTTGAVFMADFAEAREAELRLHCTR